MSTQKQTSNKLNAVMALIMGTLAMVVSFMAWSKSSANRQSSINTV